MSCRARIDLSQLIVGMSGRLMERQESSAAVGRCGRLFCSGWREDERCERGGYEEGDESWASGFYILWLAQVGRRAPDVT